jgi:hypothetical protein
MVTTARTAGSAGACAVGRPLKLSARVVNKKIALRGEGCAREIAIRQKSLTSIQP